MCHNDLFGVALFRAPIHLLTNDPGALPLAITSHAFSVKTATALDEPPAGVTSRRRAVAASKRLGSTCYFAGLCIHADDFAFLDKERHAHGQPGLERRLFAGSAGGRVAAQTQFR